MPAPGQDGGPKKGPPAFGEESAPRPVQRLHPQVARKIAAGEVIDRPYSVVRELLDNSLDAGATEIAVYLDGGGLETIRVVDNGLGMTAEDLRLSALPHSTSKIVEESDLYKVRSLGFRGEALSSMAACARLEITSRRRNAAAGHRLQMSEDGNPRVSPSPSTEGCAVTVSGLFHNMPARRRFLKSPGAESALCRTSLLDRALAHPRVTFRLFSGDTLRLFLPGSDLLERVRAVATATVERPDWLQERKINGDGFTGTLILGRPELWRKDRRLLQVFVNRRRVQEYSLVQAIEYGYRNMMPGGHHPVAFLFIEVDPELADFNIHPAKREVRLRTLPEIHRAVSQAAGEFASSFSISANGPPDSEPRPEQHDLNGLTADRSGPTRRQAQTGDRLTPGQRLESLQSSPLTERPDQPVSTVRKPNYVGQVFDLFLVAEWAGSLFVIDQHAAHERILLDELLARTKERQELLLPISFRVDREERDRLLTRSEELDRLGIELEQSGPDSLELTAMAGEFTAIEEGELIRFLKDFDRPFEDLVREINTLAACRMAIKDGEQLDPVTAQQLVEQALALEDARCPHGRPIWHRITREQLLSLVQRT